MSPCRASEPTRWLVAGAVVLAALLAPGQATAQAQPGAVLVYWSAGDCPPCKVWRTGERHDEFAAEAARLGVRLVTVAKPSLRSADSDYRWSDAGETLALDPPKTLPSFDFVCRGKPAQRLAGLANWDSFWRSQLRDLARQCAAAPQG